MFFRAIILFLLSAFLSSCSLFEQKDSEYVPISLFSPAYEALNVSSDSTSYKLESTIRIIRIFERAQSETDSFESFLELLKKQDYRYVAQDVLEAEKRLFPLMQDMYLKEQENEKMNGLWTLVKSTESSLLEMSSSIMQSGTFDLSGVIGPKTLFNAIDSSFESFAKANSLKKDSKKELNRIKSEYYSVVQEIWPVFMKYKEPWERLCIRKDEAYLDIYSGGTVKGYNIASDILAEYPEDRDAMIIKALSIANMENCGYDMLIELDLLLDKYMALYPTKTAPAYLIKGIIASRNGEAEKAFHYFDQASIEYPRQAESLTDMLDTYINRPYFTMTREGLYFQQMYKSTLEGYGFFSPNFQKALYYEKNGRIKEAADEIYNHFFRRGNQVVSDYLLSDMEFCERYLKDSFSYSFPEGWFIDLSVKQVRPVVGKPHLRVELSNNTDINLENVRCYLCLHLVGMYPGDYAVVKLDPVNIIDKESTYSWKTSEYDFSDIVSSRAILMTDNDIVWIDSKEKKNEPSFDENVLDSDSFYNADSLITDCIPSIKYMTEKTAVMNGDDQLKRNTKYLKVSIPRHICILNPSFCIETPAGNLQPEKTILAEDYIIVYFPYVDSEEPVFLRIQSGNKKHKIPLEYSAS